MSAPGDDPRVGSRLGRYLVLERLGEGAMGVVYRSRDTELDREVALKLLTPERVGDPDARERLLREARIASRLNHPHIGTIHEVGATGAQVFIAMELVTGHPLDALIPPGGMASETIARYGAQVARALAHAHAQGVVHRDLKADNVVVGPGGHAKLLDFGLSRRAPGSEAPTERTEAAPAGSGVAGTPRYLAPEVLRGARADERSDIWSLGVLLYEMSAGRSPFRPDAAAGLVGAILHDDPAPLPARIPAALRAIVARCLAKDPEQRTATAAEVAAALEALQPEADAPPASPVRRAAWRSSAALAVVGVVALAVALWLASGRLARWRVPASHTVVVLPFEVRGQVQGADFVGRAFAEAMAVDLATAAGLRVMPVPSTGEVPGSGALARAHAALRLGAGRVVVGALTREGDSLRASVSLIDAEGDQVLWGEERAASGADLALLASGFAVRVADHLGVTEGRRYDHFLYVDGSPEVATAPEWTEALGAVRRYELPRSLEATQRLLARFPTDPDAHVLRVAALMIDERAAGPDAGRLKALSEALEALRRLDPGNPWYDVARALHLPDARASAQALGRVLARRDLTPAARGAMLALRADARAASGDGSGARADAERAIRLDPASDLSLATLARTLALGGRYAEAAARVRQAIALNPTVVNYWLQLGNCMLKQGRWQDYVADLDHAAALSPAADAVRSAQSDGLSCAGRYREAAECARRALALRPARSRYALQLALCDLRLGAWREAVPLLERACAEGGPAPCAARAAAAAVVAWDTGARASAEARAREAEELPESKSGDVALACYLLRRGERDAALARLERLPRHDWVEPALERHPDLAALRTEPRFQQVAAWMRAQPVDRVFAGWESSR